MLLIFRPETAKSAVRLVFKFLSPPVRVDRLLLLCFRLHGMRESRGSGFIPSTLTHTPIYTHTRDRFVCDSVWESAKKEKNLNRLEGGKKTGVKKAKKPSKDGPSDTGEKVERKLKCKAGRREIAAKKATGKVKMWANERTLGTGEGGENTGRG